MIVFMFFWDGEKHSLVFVIGGCAAGLIHVVGVFGVAFSTFHTYEFTYEPLMFFWVMGIVGRISHSCVVFAIPSLMIRFSIEGKRFTRRSVMDLVALGINIGYIWFLIHWKLAEWGVPFPLPEHLNQLMWLFDGE
eukprot:TRINITY_DN5119_c0_g1_i1.p2 TRINITY_DN5119_c0_g1~~TRINITY_DN5119_c0_g1_i1.p2  ORF type:complete len:135 (+),score=19.08 TRINITY_DN5119_c0_g1_i1:171-575(+)